MDEFESQSNGFQHSFEILKRRKWLALVSFMAALAAGVTIVTFLPEVYRSSATVLIERQQIPDELVRATVTSTLETRLYTISQQILSRSRLEPLISQFGLYTELQGKLPTELIIDRMRKNIGLELRGGEQRRGNTTTVAFTISYSGRDAQKVAIVTNTLASFYIEENLKVREQQAVGTADFLRTQLEEMQQNLETQEKRLSTFKEKHVGELPHHQEANLATLEQLNARLRLNNDNQIQVSDRRAAIAAQLADARGFGTEGPDFATVRLAQMKQQLAELQRTYSDKYPDVIQLKSEIAKLEAKIGSAEEDGLLEEAAPMDTPYVLQLKKAITEEDARLNALQAEADRLRQSISMYQNRVENAPKREQEYQVLSRDYETTKELYRSLLLRQKEAELAENMEQRQKGEQFRILDPATISERPAAPNRARLYPMVALLSLGLAAGLVLLIEKLDTSFHSIDDLRSSYPEWTVLSIPLIVTRRDRRRKKLRFALAAFAAVLGLVAIVGSSYFIATGNTQLTELLLR